MSNHRYNIRAIDILAKLKAAGFKIKINRKQALAALRDMLAQLALDGDGDVASNALIKILQEYVPVEHLTEKDGEAIRRVFHFLIGFSV